MDLSCDYWCWGKIWSRFILMGKKAASLIISLEVIGFIGVIIIIWSDELFDLPHKLFNTPSAQPNLAEGLLESGLVLILGVMIISITLLMLQRIRDLQSFIYVCAWCKKLKIDAEWISFEKFLDDYHGTQSSHGICPDCYRQYKRGQDDQSTK